MGSAVRPLSHSPPLALLTCVVLTAAAGGARAEQSVRELPQLEVIGSADRLPGLPGSASLIDAEELEMSRVFTVNEALRKAPGVNVRDEEGLGLRPAIGIRGLNPTRSTKTLLLEDGIPLAYAPYGDNASYYHPPVERFDRIEVLKGAGQVLFGPQTVGGLVNYITPDPPEQFEGMVRATGGNRDYLNAHLRLGGRGLQLDYMRKQGEGARDNVYSELNDLNLKGVFDLGASHALTLRANYYTEDSDLTYSGITEAERRNFGLRYNPFDNDFFEAERWGASVSHEWRFGPSVSLLTNLYGSHFSRDWWRQASTTTDIQCGAAFRAARLAGQPVDPDACASIQGRLRDYYAYGVEPRLQVAHGLLGLDQELEVGLRVHRETQDRLQIDGASPAARSGVLVEDNGRDTTAYALFVQNKATLAAFTLMPALRVEHVQYERTDALTGAEGDTALTALIPGFGVTFNPVDSATLFAGVHRGFAPPRTEDLIGTPAGAPTATFTDVGAEESWNFELGARLRPEAGLELEATVFRSEFDNQIAVGSIAGGTTPLAQGEALYQGLELLGRVDSQGLLRTHGNLYFQAAYTRVAEAEQTSPFIVVANGSTVPGSASGNRMPYAPENLFTGTLGYTHPWGWDLRLEGVYIGEQFSDFANTLEAPVNGNGQVGLIKESLIFNAALNVPVPAWNATLFLTAKNLLDRDYIVDRTRGILPGAPLLVQGGLEVRF